MELTLGKQTEQPFRPFAAIKNALLKSSFVQSAINLFSHPVIASKAEEAPINIRNLPKIIGEVSLPKPKLSTYLVKEPRHKESKLRPENREISIYNSIYQRIDDAFDAYALYSRASAFYDEAGDTKEALVLMDLISVASHLRSDIYSGEFDIRPGVDKYYEVSMFITAALMQRAYGAGLLNGGIIVQRNRSTDELTLSYNSKSTFDSSIVVNPIARAMNTEHGFVTVGYIDSVLGSDTEIITRAYSLRGIDYSKASNKFAPAA